MSFYIIIFVLIIFLLFIWFIYLLEYKIKTLEHKIKALFSKRTWLISSLYELTKNDLVRHDEIFINIIKYKKIELSQLEYNDSFINLINTEILIHNELNFIFKVCNKHQRLTKKWNFIYIRELFIEKSREIWNNIDIYKNITKRFNKLIWIKNITIVWLLFPINKKDLF